jgi:hypothetical protein
MDFIVGETYLVSNKSKKTVQEVITYELAAGLDNDLKIIVTKKYRNGSYSVKINTADNLNALNDAVENEDELCFDIFDDYELVATEDLVETNFDFVQEFRSVNNDELANTFIDANNECMLDQLLEDMGYDVEHVVTFIEGGVDVRNVPSLN